MLRGRRRWPIGGKAQLAGAASRGRPGWYPHVILKCAARAARTGLSPSTTHFALRFPRRRTGTRTEQGEPKGGQRFAAVPGDLRLGPSAAGPTQSLRPVEVKKSRCHACQPQSLLRRARPSWVPLTRSASTRAPGATSGRRTPTRAKTPTHRQEVRWGDGTTLDATIQRIIHTATGQKLRECIILATATRLGRDLRTYGGRFEARAR